MATGTSSEQPKRDPYAELNDIDKLTEELKSEVASLKNRLQELEGCISQHHDAMTKS